MKKEWAQGMGRTGKRWGGVNGLVAEDWQQWHMPNLILLSGPDPPAPTIVLLQVYLLINLI